MWREQVSRNPGRELEEINALAFERIRYFQKKIEEEFGVHTITGTEIEFFVLKKNGRLIVPLQTLDKPVSANDFAAQINQRMQPFWHNKPDKPKSVMNGAVFVERVENDFTKRATEYVMGYRPVGEEYKEFSAVLKYRAPEYQAKLALGMMRFLADMQARSQQDKKFLNKYGISEVSFESKAGWDYHYTAAFQPSVSLWTESGKNLFLSNDGESFSRLANLCAMGLFFVQQESALLAANYPESYDQYYDAFCDKPSDYAGDYKLSSPRRFFKIDWNNRRDIEASVAQRQSEEKTKESNTNETRIENRLPRADSNPVLAMLQTVAGMYYALSNYTEIISDPKKLEKRGTVEYQPVVQGKWLQMPWLGVQYNDKCPIGDHHDAHKIFSSSKMMKQMLGEELHGRVRDYFSPEAIKSREAAMAAAQR